MKAYRFLAYMIAVLVVVQAAAIAWGFFGMTNWIDDGGVLNKEFLDCERTATRCSPPSGASRIHMFFIGLLLIPLTSLVLLIVSFFAKVPGRDHVGRGIFGLVVLQVFVLPSSPARSAPGFGALHGLNAMLILWASRSWPASGRRRDRRAAGRAGAGRTPAGDRLTGW